MFLRHIALKHGREQNAQEKVRPRHPDIAPNVQQIADQDIGMGVVACALFKAGEIEKAPVPVKETDQKAGGTAAEKAGDDAHREYWLENGRIILTLPPFSGTILRHGGDGGLKLANE